MSKVKKVFVKKSKTPQKTGKQKRLSVKIKKPKLFSHRFSSFFLIPLILVIILAIMLVIDGQIQYVIWKDTPRHAPFQFTPHGYPVFNQTSPIDITAKSAIVLDLPSHTVLYEKNPTLRFSMASTTKLMTALTALSYYHLSSVVTVKRAYVEGSKIGLIPGQQFTVADILYAMFLPSANDAAYVLADNYPGGKAAFVSEMNKNAHKYFLTNTHYMDPAGLEDDGDYTTVVDLARLAAIAIQNPTIAKIIDTKNYVISDITGTYTYPLQNLNELLGYDGIDGVKTGTTEGAGEVLITSQKQGNHTYIIVVMKSQDRFSDTLNIVDALSGNVTYIEPEESLPH